MNAISCISLIMTALMFLIAAITLVRAFFKDGKNNSNSLTRVETKIDYIGGQITEVRDDVKTINTRQQDMAVELATVKDSVKSAHHRIDGIEEKLSKEE